MSSLISPEFSRVLLLAGIVAVHVHWRQLITRLVPEPYLDEVFHVPQAQAYWAGKWSQWDSKITTPPGLYLFSYGVNSIRSWFQEPFEQSTEELRFSNSLLLYLLLVILYVWSAVTRREVHHEAVLQREFSIVLFPLLFFFSGLYYTDLFSVFTVVVTYVCWSAARRARGGMKMVYQILHVVSGLVALATRQTNIFWVAVYLGGLQVVQSTKREAGVNMIHDPPISEAFFEDFLITSISITQHGVGILPSLLLDLWPSLSLLASFAAFVLWNGGVVLGDKNNHVAGLHLPQLLYLFPFIIFFSWPVLLPLLSDRSTLTSRLPRRATVGIFLVLSGVAIYSNTVIHPFLLADNRHYMFYVVRILILKHWLIKYLAIPIYLLCGWLSIAVLGGKARPRRGSVVAISQGRVAPDTVHVSFVLVWLVSTTLSLVTAPLIEPRYFIVPWLMWRLHVPEVFPTQPRIEPVEGMGQIIDDKGRKVSTATPLSSLQSRLQPLLAQLARWSPWIEFMWYMTINLATCWLFLNRPFEWKQEPGEEQRFLW